jgi:hypothetical protein
MESGRLAECMKMVDEMDRDELRYLNDHCIARYRELNREKAQEKMSDLSVGDPVRFTHKGIPYEGRITKLNRKTVSVDTGEERGWLIPPALLEKVS